MSISVVINTKNSATTITKAIQSVQFAAEVIVVDMHSTDGTTELAKKFDSKIFLHKDVQYVEPARQFAISKASNSWVFVLDADEEVPKKLAEKLMNITSEDSPAAAYAIARKNLVFGHWIQHAGWWPDYQIRFFQKGAVTWSENIHSQPEVSGRLEVLPADQMIAIQHHNYESISSFIQRLDRYTTIQAKLDGAKTRIDGATVVSAFKHEFLSRAFAQSGYKAGLHGIALSLLQAFSEVTRELKRWELAGSKPKQFSSADLESFSDLRAELAYWVAEYQVEHQTGIKKLIWMIRRKFQV